MYSRNPLIVSSLREFPEPPSIDAGEGVRMMFSTMKAVGLYPPFYINETRFKGPITSVSELSA